MFPAKQIDKRASNGLQVAVWTDSETVCCLADEERHLGHIVRAGGNWLAFDATHLNDHGTSFRCLGCCTTITLAKFAVERVFGEVRAMTATLQ
jgi:hypothetical protein